MSNDNCPMTNGSPIFSLNEGLKHLALTDSKPAHQLTTHFNPFAPNQENTSPPFPFGFPRQSVVSSSKKIKATSRNSQAPKSTEDNEFQQLKDQLRETQNNTQEQLKEVAGQLKELNLFKHLICEQVQNLSKQMLDLNPFKEAVQNPQNNQPTSLKNSNSRIDKTNIKPLIEVLNESNIPYITDLFYGTTDWIDKEKLVTKLLKNYPIMHINLRLESKDSNSLYMHLKNSEKEKIISAFKTYASEILKVSPALVSTSIPSEIQNLAQSIPLSLIPVLKLVFKLSTKLESLDQKHREKLMVELLQNNKPASVINTLKNNTSLILDNLRDEDKLLLINAFTNFALPKTSTGTPNERVTSKENSIPGSKEIADVLLAEKLDSPLVSVADIESSEGRDPLQKLIKDLPESAHAVLQILFGIESTDKKRFINKLFKNHKKEFVINKLKYNDCLVYQVLSETEKNKILSAFENYVISLISGSNESFKRLLLVLGSSKTNTEWGEDGWKTHDWTKVLRDFIPKSLATLYKEIETTDKKTEPYFYLAYALDKLQQQSDFPVITPILSDPASIRDYITISDNNRIQDITQAFSSWCLK